MKNIIRLLTMLCASYVQAQIMPCGTMEAPVNDLVIYPQLKQQQQTTPIKTIPVVFHIVYDREPDSSMFAGGMSNARLAIQMQILNECFRKRNADTSEILPVFKSIAADSRIEFCLNEVRYKKTTVTPYFPTNDAMKKLPTGSPAKDPFKYLNIWVCRLNDGTTGVGGFAYYPSPGVTGQYFDGVVSHTTYVGGDDRRTGEVTVHEVGHYLDLPHTFILDSACTHNPLHLGDYSADTPPTSAPAGGCNLTRPSCIIGIVSNNQNYMEYTDCSAMFTNGQSTRMGAALISKRNALWNSGTCSGTPGNTPPVCSISFPTNNQQFPSPSNITINVSATDANGTVTKVEFYSGGTLLSTVQTQPYSFVYPNVTTGSYALTARATDNGGANTTSGIVNIIVGTNTAPTCVIISPVNGAPYVYPSSVRMETSATDVDGIAKVEYSIDNTWLTFQLTTPPYSLSWVAPIGTHSIKARATDRTGQVTISQTVSITVTGQTNPPPVVSITSPVTGAVYTTPASITITATATDNTSVSRVEFYAGTVLWGSDGTSPYSFTKAMVGAGSYVLTARAYDSQNASSVSSPVSVTVTAGATDSPVNTIILMQNNALKFKANDGRERIIP